jgi:hypothetical protein
VDYLESFRAFHGEYYGNVLCRFTLNCLDIIFLVAFVNITDIFFWRFAVCYLVSLMPHPQLSPYFVGYLTVNFLDDMSCVSPSDIPMFCLPSDGGYSGYYVGHLTVTVDILGIISEGPR